MLVDQPFDGAQIVRCNPSITCELNRREPKLAFPIGCADVNMGGFVSFIGIKVEPKGTETQHGRHWSKMGGPKGRCQIFLDPVFWEDDGDR